MYACMRIANFVQSLTRRTTGGKNSEDRFTTVNSLAVFCAALQITERLDEAKFAYHHCVPQRDFL